MSLKRKRNPAHATSAPRKISCIEPACPDGSRFVDCPICGKSIAFQLVNAHLDTACASATEHSETRKDTYLHRQDKARGSSGSTGDAQRRHWLV